MAYGNRSSARRGARTRRRWRNSNAGARRLYERHGYREIASRPTVKNGWRTPIQNWLLLVKGRAMAS